MKDLRQYVKLFLISLAISIPISAGISITSPGGISAGTSLTGGTANRFVVTDATGLIQTPASLVADVSGAGTFTLTALKTPTGGALTSNWLNITATQPTTLTAAFAGIYFDLTTAGSSAQTIHGLRVTLEDGYTGSSSTAAIRGIAEGSGTANTEFSSIFHAGVFGSAARTSGSGAFVGVAGVTTGNTSQKNYGGFFNGTGGATNNIGAGIFASGGTNNVGAYIGLNTAVPTYTTSALTIDNSSVAAPILLARDNGTTVFSIEDGGEVRDTIGNKVLNADYTNATTTFSNLNHSVTVVSGQNYIILLDFSVLDSTAADGIKIDFNGGSAAATNFRIGCGLISDTGTAVAFTAATSTSLAGVINAGAMATANQHTLRCVGSFVPSSNGTFIPRAAQNAHSTGTLTIHRGSALRVANANAQ